MMIEIDAETLDAIARAWLEETLRENRPGVYEKARANGKKRGIASMQALARGERP